MGGGGGGRGHIDWAEKCHQKYNISGARDIEGEDHCL
jgi:hypothetical protein